MPGCKVTDPGELRDEERVPRHEETPNPIGLDRIKGAAEIAGSLYFHRMDGHAK
jgi:hypothetical protein